MVAEDKEGKLGRSQIIKCLANHDKKIRGHQEATGECLGVMSFICVAERGMLMIVIALAGKLRQGKGRVGHGRVGQERQHVSLYSR